MRQNGVLCTHTVWNMTDRQPTDFGRGRCGTGWGRADKTSDGGGPRGGGGWATKMGWGSDRAGEKRAGGRGGHAGWTGVENEVGGMGRKNVLKIQNATKMSYFDDNCVVQHVTFLSYFVIIY